MNRAFAVSGGWLLPLLLIASVWPARASAADPAHHHVADAHYDHMVFGVKGVSTVEQATSHGHSETLTGYGVSGMVERTFLHERLAIELDFVFLSPGDEHTFSTEPIAKLPWHVARWFEPYAGVGPMLVVADTPEQRSVMGGGQVVLGALFWLAELAGLDIDVTLGAARGPELSIVEATLAVGPVVRN